MNGWLVFGASILSPLTAFFENRRYSGIKKSFEGTEYDRS